MIYLCPTCRTVVDDDDPCRCDPPAAAEVIVHPPLRALTGVAYPSDHQEG